MQRFELYPEKSVHIVFENQRSKEYKVEMWYMR